jgi:valyl-tRNA synthetase
MEISKHYNPGQIEEKWYRYWLEHKLFNRNLMNGNPIQ